MIGSTLLVAQAAVAMAPYRYGDLLWENDRTAHRIYGQPLEAAEPPSGSGIDAWGKRAGPPFMDRQLRAGRQHLDEGAGVDFYHVGQSRGVGGLGIWFDNKLWTSRNYRAARILTNGPKVARFEVDYAPWPVDVTRRVWETRRFSLRAGDNLTRMDSILRSNRPEPLLVGIGVARRPVAGAESSCTADVTKGVFTCWSASDPVHGAMGTAVRVDPRMIVREAQDSENRVVLLRVVPGRPFTYFAGATWSKAGQFASAEAWRRHVEQLDVAFTEGRTPK